MRPVSDIRHYVFDPRVPVDAIEDALVIAAVVAEGVHGRARVRREADFSVDARRPCCTIDVTTVVGRSINSVFLTLAFRMFGRNAFFIEPTGGQLSPRTARMRGSPRHASGAVPR